MISVCLFESDTFGQNQNKSKSKRTGGRRSSPVRRDGIVPDVIDSVPKGKITVKYTPGLEVKYGNELTPTQVKVQPVVEWPADKDSYYTLAMVDPDAPSRKDPMFGQYKHWLVINIAGSDVTKGKSLAEYKGSGPPKDTGLHRYIFLVYKQPGIINTTEKTVATDSLTGRPFFKVRDYAKTNRLGQPVAINYFQAQFDGSLG
ncbi:unnamed protein product [Medioppia subpectinata]|uniref:Uncharacterized protein n=1 Tax=Medioppia subpectinata TaxID=1979941 RepID=A0A7R9LFM3_9ACAR|nr:unnamed protein product [Medioppia subpectinata]CAG2118417.1 unnamed protein product [Medioppia subpectinata]